MRLIVGIRKAICLIFGDMEDLKRMLTEFVVDNLSGFSLSDIPNYLLSLCLAALWAWVLGRFFMKGAERNETNLSFAKHFLVLAVALTVLVTIVRFSIPLAIVFAGILALIRYKLPANNTREFVYLFLILVVGVGCGAGHGILTTLGMLILLPVLWWYNRKKTA